MGSNYDMITRTRFEAKEVQKDPKDYFDRLHKEHDERAAQSRAKWRPSETLSGN
jgi:hypothetical protein